MMGSRFSLLSPGMGAMGLPFDSVFGKDGDDSEPVAIQRKKLASQSENVRLRLVAQQQKRLAETAKSSGLSRMAPILVVGAVVAVGAVALVMRARRKRP